MMVLSRLGTALRAHAISAVLVWLVLSIGGALLGVPFWLAGPAWLLTSLVALEARLVLEPVALRLRGCRSATPDERLMLGLPSLSVYVQEVDELRVTAGLRSLVATRGAFEFFEPKGLAALAVQAQLAAEPGRLVIGIGTAPMLVLWWVTLGVGRLGLLLMLSAAGVLVWAFGQRFATVAGWTIAAVLLVIAGAELIASGLVALGVGLLSAWAVKLGLDRLLAWEVEQVEARADVAAADLGLGVDLLQALERLRKLGWPVAPRIAQLRAKLEAS
jgi:hypothetical protein